MNALAVVHFVPILVAVGAVIGVFALALRSAVHAVPPGQALVITRPQGPPRVRFSNTVVIPIVQRAEAIDLAPMSIVIARAGKDGIICADNIRIDVRVSFWVRVGPTAEEVLRVATSVGCARATERDTVEQLFVAKFAEALKIVARRHDFLELAAAPGEFRDEVAVQIGQELAGYRLDEVVIERLEHTSIDALDRNNVLDAQGLRKLERLLEEGAVPPPVSTVETASASAAPSAPPAAPPGGSPDALLPGPGEPRTLITCAALEAGGDGGGGESRSLRLEPSAPARLELRRGVQTLSSIDLTLPVTAHLSVAPAPDGSLDGAQLLLTLRQRAAGMRQELAVATDLTDYLAALPTADAAAASEAAGALPRLRAEAIVIAATDMVRLLSVVRFVQEADGPARWV